MFPYSERGPISRAESDLRKKASDLSVDLTQCSSLSPCACLREHDLSEHCALISHLAGHEHKIAIESRSEPCSTRRPDAPPESETMLAQWSMRLRQLARQRWQSDDVSLRWQLATTEITEPLLLLDRLGSPARTLTAHAATRFQMRSAASCWGLSLEQALSQKTR